MKSKKQYYINIRDYQGGSWAMGCIDTIKDWKTRAMEWADSDENWGLYNELKRHKLDEELIDIINEIWDINIVKFCKDNKYKILEGYGIEENGTSNLYWLVDSMLDILD